MERILYDILGATYMETMPTVGTVSKALLHTFLLARKTEGASRPMVLAEIKCWRELLLEIGDAYLPEQWLELKVNRLFSSRF